MPTVYNAVKEVPKTDEEAALKQEPVLSEPMNAKKGLVVAGALAVAFMLGFAANTGGSPATLSAPAAVRDCDFAECTRGGCDANSAPFLCLDEKTAYMGCNANSWGDYCSDSCNMENCASAKPGDDLESCEGVKCAAEKCDLHYQRCGDDAPYQCTSGSAANGCSTDKYAWLLLADTQCGGCCDARAC